MWAGAVVRGRDRAAPLVVEDRAAFAPFACRVAGRPSGRPDGACRAGAGETDSGKKTWSPVIAVLFVETRIWHRVKFARPFVSGGAPAGRQLNNDCGLSPANGTNARFAIAALKTTLPPASAIAGGGELPRSQ